jgi:flagellar FliL protein
MADPEIVEGNEGGEKPAAPKKPLNVALIIAIVVGLLVLIGSGVAAVVLVSALAKAGRPAAESHEGAAEAPAKEEKKAAAHGEAKKSGGHGEAKKKKEGGGAHGGAKKGGGAGGSELLYDFEKPIIVNLAESNAERYLKIDVVLELDAEKTKEELQGRLPQVQDLLITITATKTMDDVSTVSGRNMLRQEMVDKINAVLTEGQVKSVYFTEFVIQ